MNFFTKEPIKRKLLLLAGIFIAALTTVVMTEVYLRHLTHNYNAAIENQMVHRRLGRVIIRKLIEIEKNVFGLDAADDIRDVPVFEEQILSSIGTIESTLGVLQNGGAFVDVLPANIIEKDNITEEFFYRKTGDADYIIEVIDLTPKIVDIKELSVQLFRAVRRRFESLDKEQRQNSKSEATVLLKRLNTFLLRSRENATKIFYESHQEIQRFEQLKGKAVSLFSIIRYSVILIVGIVAAITFVFVFHQIGEIIENRKKAEAKVNTLKQQMEFILGTTNTGLDIIDSDFNIQYIDPEWQKVYGDPKGRKCYEYFMDRNEACPGCGMVKALRTKSIAVTEEILIKENNRPVQVSTIPFQNEDSEWLVAEAKVDITERKRNEQELRKHRDHLEELVKKRTAELDQIFNTAADGMRVIDKDFNVLRINDTLATLAKQSKDEMFGKKCYETLFSSSCHTADCPLTRILHEENVSRLSVELEKRRTDGTKFPCIVTATPFFGPDGKLVGIVEDIKDISNRKQAEKELEKKMKELEDFTELAVGRELKMIELKKEINRLLVEAGMVAEYEIVK